MSVCLLVSGGSARERQKIIEIYVEEINTKSTRFNIMTERRYFRIIFRLSSVVALIAAAVDANTIRKRSVEETYRVLFLEMKMDCAVQLTKDQLASVRNEYGNYDIARYCGAGEDGITYFVADYELEDHRNGIFVSRFDMREFRPFVDWESNLVMFALSFLLFNFLGACLYLFFVLVKWIFK
jgi:hypothetical protein